jgi:predicted N-acetyltransferase YhbS
MAAEITIRAERHDDAETISKLVRRAYANVAYSDHREHLMIERLRGTDAYDRALSLLADINGETVGHILLTRAQIVGAQSSVPTLALAPLSVVPEHQAAGVGKRLVGAAHAQATALGFKSIVLVGIPSYYPQFGYEPLSRYPITLPFAAPDANCMILRLTPDALVGVAGMVKYAEAWLDH